MPKHQQVKKQLIDSIVERIEKRLPKQPLCAELARKLLITVALEDLQDRALDDLYGLVVSLWNCIVQRKADETKINIYNPDYERYGWQSTHTVVEVVCNDMPFLVDSIRMEINRLGLTTHLIVHMGGLHVTRDKKNQPTNIQYTITEDRKIDDEIAVVYFEIDRQTSDKKLEEIRINIERILCDVKSAVQDWGLMRSKVHESITELKRVAQSLDPDELKESIDFLKWIDDENFTFLGVRDYTLKEKKGEHVLQVVAASGCGVLSEASVSKVSRSLASMTPEARELFLSQQILIISKTSTISTVHRPAYTDYIGVKRFNKKGEVIGERRFIGLYGATAYYTDLERIPFVGRKIELVSKKSGFSPKSHAGKRLMNILGTLPRDDLFHAQPDDLLEVAMGIYYMQERRCVRLFMLKDVFGRFISCLVYVPKDRYNTEVREEMQKILMEAFNAKDVLFSPRFFESVLARIHFLVLLDRENPPSTDCDVEVIEQQLIKVARNWDDELFSAIFEAFGEELGNGLIGKYSGAFSASYREDYNPHIAVQDIKHLEAFEDEKALGMNLYVPLDEIDGTVRFKIYKHRQYIPLSDALPILENMGLRVTSERPYQLRFANGEVAWINDFSMHYCGSEVLNIEKVRNNFEEAFEKIWFGYARNDGLNRLILHAGLTWRQITILRAYAKYFRQIRFPFSQEYIANTLTLNSAITRDLVALFETRFNPEKNPNRQKQLDTIISKIGKALDQVENLEQDRTLRHYMEAIKSTLRTNYFQALLSKTDCNYLSFKMDPSGLPGVPLPLPMREIYVYSPRLEGVHLRAGKVARGGIRWSDRREDFRTEILGLMKAQVVKNSVIVPTGAKGGFVPKHLPTNGSREEIMAEGISCYKDFICALLDITDNLKNGAVVKPKDVVCWDEDDDYLVVAADKGTATFSDIANEIAAEYDFWLGDAFASGGSSGYDHKKMGITARGAWESVKRHFRELGKDIQTEDFTATGIGDMAGDVFGNGMLLSRHIKLVAAFNHVHIFIDPNPDTKKSYQERERLFNLPRSSWEDYDKKLISKGGGVFSRAAKSISLTPEIQQLLQVKHSAMTPNDLMRAILCAPVDLFWSGGIGTFIKAERESDADVGDKTNDNIRVDATQLRCKVVGEGANLGVTQKGRVEFSLQGGLIYSDFIDNSGGVDCSDHEVNIKILLDDVVKNGDMTRKQRDKLLVDMTEEVARLVLYNNYKQSQAISLAASQSLRNIDLHNRYIAELEMKGRFKRNLESLPDEKALMERKALSMGLTRPGLSVLVTYSKIMIKEALLDSDVPEDPYLSNAVLLAFPKPIRDNYREQLQQHRLRREIVATLVSSILVNEVGFTFVYRLREETGAVIPTIVKAYTCAREIIQAPKIWQQIDTLDNKVTSTTQHEMLMRMTRLLRRLTHWLLHRYGDCLSATDRVAYFTDSVQKLKQILPEVLSGEIKEYYRSLIKKLLELKVPKGLANEFVTSLLLFSAFDIIEVADKLKMSLKDVASVYFCVTETLQVGWLRLQIVDQKVENHWEALSREALRDDLDIQLRALAANVLSQTPKSKKADDRIEMWMDKHAIFVKRWQGCMADLRTATTLNYVMFFAAVRLLSDLAMMTAEE